MKNIENIYNFEDSRRTFIKNALSAVVMTSFFPHNILGRLYPKITEKEDKLTALFDVNFDVNTKLKEVWGSVRLAVEWIPPEEHYPKIFVTKVPKEEFDGVEYISVTEKCSHEGNELEDLNPDTHLFFCKKGHGSYFLVDGTPFWGEALKINKPLKPRYPVYYRSGDNHLSLEVDFPIVLSVPDENNITYLKQNFPNPCNSSTNILFGIEKPAEVKIILSDLRGNGTEVFSKIIEHGGEYSINLNTSSYANGTYLSKMFVNGKLSDVKKMIIMK